MSQRFKCRFYQELNDVVMKFDPHQNWNTSPNVHKGLSSCFMEIRGELYRSGRLNLQKRKQKLRELLISDYLQEDKELREVGLAYINTQP